MEAATSGVALPRLARERAVPAVAFAAMAATVAYGLIASAGPRYIGTTDAPFLYHWDPGAGALAPVAVAIVLAGLAAAPRLAAASVSPLRFAAALLVLGLLLRVGLGVARDGLDGLWAVYQVPHPEAASEYLPALPALAYGTHTFLDTFAQVGPSLTVNAVGHPPGLLLVLHFLGVDSARGMAALTILAGALSVPLTYVLARELVDEGPARAATLLYAFSPSAVLFGATSADALYVTLALLAAVALLSHRRAVRAAGPLALALASFFSYANLAIGAFAAVVAWRRHGRRHAIVLAAACAAGLLAFYALLYLATGFDPVGAIRSAESVYREGIASRRPYAFWVFGSPTAFLITAGVPIAWLALRSLARGDSVAVALFVVIGVAVVLGVTKAETERIWLFLVPPLCVAAAAVMPARRLPLVLAALAAQALAIELLTFTFW